jgi:hypothetical protein
MTRPWRVLGVLRSKLRARVTGWSARRRAVVIGALLSCLGSGIVIGVILVILGPLAWLVAGDSVRRLSGAAQASAINNVRGTLLTALGGSAALVALAFTVRTYYLSRRGQVTDRFNKGVVQLASDKLEERLGGIYTLEQVMAESPADHAAVLGMLCAFVRTRTLLPPPPDEELRNRIDPVDQEEPAFGTEPLPDIDAAMIAIARRPSRAEANRPDLRRTALVGIGLRIYDFTEAPRLTRMFLTASDLRNADLRGADLRGTIATGIDLRWAHLSQANLSRSSFSRAQMRGVSFIKANLMGAMLDDADLREAEGLTAQQLSCAFFDDRTLFSPELSDDPWVKARLADCMALPGDAGPWACPPPTPKP